MKKLLLALAVFGGVFSLCAVELPAAGWNIHTARGKFTYQKDKYPLLISCQTPTADKAGNLGVFGRLYRKEMLESGKKYELKITYKLTNCQKGQFAVWVRGGANVNMIGKASDTPKTMSRTFTLTKSDVMIYFNLITGTGDIEIISAELSQVD